MARINATMSISLDGVIQAPGRSDEDTRDGFERGGWAVPYGDDVMMQKMGEGMSGASAMLFGRRTYEDFAGYWPHQTDNPFTAHLNQADRILDDRRRASVLNEADRGLASDVPTIPLFHFVVTAAYDTWVRNFVFVPWNPLWNAENWWLAE